MIKQQGFSGDPRLSHGRTEATLLSDFSYTDDCQETHTVKKGEVTDGASIPRFFWRVVGSPMDGEYLPAAIIHDHYCRCANDIPCEKERDQLRLQADNLFRQMLAYLEISSWKVVSMYIGVRIGSHGSGKKEGK